MKRIGKVQRTVTVEEEVCDHGRPVGGYCTACGADAIALPHRCCEHVASVRQERDKLRAALRHYIRQHPCCVGLVQSRGIDPATLEDGE